MLNKFDFPTIGLVISGALCVFSIYTSSKEGLAVAQTIAAIAGTAFQTQINANKDSKAPRAPAKKPSTLP